MKESILFFDEVGLQDVSKVGSKNASLGEFFQQLSPNGIVVPDGFATTAKVYQDFLRQNHLETKLSTVLNRLDVDLFSNISEVGNEVRSLLDDSIFPYHTQVQIIAAYNELAERVNMECPVAVRSSAVFSASKERNFAGQLESYLDVRGEDALLTACKKCYTSLFTNKAIKYAVEMGIHPMEIANSIGIQQMVRRKQSPTPVKFSLNNKDQQRLSEWSAIIDNHFEQPMNIEWMKDSVNGKLYILQVSPEPSNLGSLK